MLLDDDGQAFKEARKFSDTLRARLDGAPQPARELPPLPELGIEWTTYGQVKVHRMLRDYARAAIAYMKGASHD
jgi:hypothetical protein